MNKATLIKIQVKHDIKAKLTQSATGASGGEGARNHIQVIANSGVASILILLHFWDLKKSGRYDYSKDLCWERHSDPLVVGIVAYFVLSELICSVTDTPQKLCCRSCRHVFVRTRNPREVKASPNYCSMASCATRNKWWGDLDRPRGRFAWLVHSFCHIDIIPTILQRLVLV